MYKIIYEALGKKPRIAVVGDVMIDRYITGQVKRISPEAPVPVLKVGSHRHNAGGAGNVTVNLAGLNTSVTLWGFIGDDSSSVDLKRVLDERGIEHRLSQWNRPTINKTRVISGQQQIVRIDEEVSYPVEKDEEDSFLISLDELTLEEYSVVILSDYAKGACTPNVCQRVIQLAKKSDIPVIVDPKGKEWNKYNGAYLITPNLKELSDILDREIENSDEEVEKAGREILETYHFENLLVTRSEKGMTLFCDGKTEHYPTMARDVFDVSGAGDTVIAGIGRFLATGVSLSESIVIANFSAGIVVGHMGTWPITGEELLTQAEKEYTAHDETRDREFFEVLQDLKKRHIKLVFTNGCFDILHPGHLDYLKKARDLGDYLIVGLNSDASVKRLKGDLRPVNSEEVRTIMLEALGFVDRVVIFNEETPLELIKQVRPDILVKGGDYSLEDIVGREFATETLTIPFLEGYSTTSLIERIQKAYE